MRIPPLVGSVQIHQHENGDWPTGKHSSFCFPRVMTCCASRPICNREIVHGRQVLPAFAACASPTARTCIYRKQPVEGGRYLERGVELPASQMGLHHAALSCEQEKKYICIYFFFFHYIYISTFISHQILRGRLNNLIEIFILCTRPIIIVKVYVESSAEYYSFRYTENV